MPSILLINNNKIVSRLLQLSSQKHNYTLEEINNYTPSGDSYNVVFIDSENYDAEVWETLKGTLSYDRVGFIGDKTHTKPEEFDFVLEKPFLPTDFVNLMNENFKVMTPEEEAQINDELEEMEDVESEQELDLDSLEEMEELDESEISLDDEDLESLSEDIVAPIPLTTGITDSIVPSEEQEEIADIMDEIENMEDEVLEEMDLDALTDEVDEIVSDSIVDESMVKESLQEVEIDEVVEEVEEKSTPVAAIAAGVTATVAAVTSAVDSSKEEVEEEFEDALNILDGVEAIETEDDYLKENEHVVEDLAGEFDSLNEEEVEKLMAGEEIVSEEFVTGEEKIVESNDLEEMITRAVSKAITKEMLQEALKDMEITVKLQAKNKES